MRNGSAILALAEGSATTARAEILKGIKTLVVRRLVEGGSAGNRASSQLGRAKLGVTAGVSALRLPVTVVVRSTTVVVATVRSTAVVVATVRSSTIVIATVDWGLGRRRAGGSRRWRSVLLAAPGAFGPRVALLASGLLRNVGLLRRAAALLVVPVPFARRAVTRARRSGRVLGTSVLETSVEFAVPEFTVTTLVIVVMAVGAGLQGRLCCREAGESCGEGNDGSKGFHFCCGMQGCRSSEKTVWVEGESTPERTIKQTRVAEREN